MMLSVYLCRFLNSYYLIVYLILIEYYQEVKKTRNQENWWKDIDMAKNKGQTPEQKRLTISSKRQITIPQKFYTELGFEKDAVCTMGDGFLVIQPARKETDGDFAEQILAELIVEGYSGQELLAEFKKRQSNIRPAIESLLKEAKTVAQGNGEYYTYDDVFGREN